MTADEAMALGNPRAKMLVHLIAESCMKCVGSAVGETIPGDLAPTDTDLSGGQKLRVTPTCAAPAEPSTDGGSESHPVPILHTTRRRSPYRDVYDLGRITYADRLDAEGKSWTPAHQHNAALRLVGKAVLRDLWLAAQP